MNQISDSLASGQRKLEHMPANRLRKLAEHMPIAF